MRDFHDPPPLCNELNDVVLHLSGKLVPEYIVSNDAPGSYRELCGLLDGGNTLVVYSGGSQNTIFGDPAINHAFRAWHDWSHWQYQFDFSLYGETCTCAVQLAHVHQHYGVKTLHTIQPYLIAEVIGQRRYYETYGEYIEDQRAFVLAYINDSEAALSQRW